MNAAIIGGLVIAAVTAIVGLLWKLSRDQAETRATLMSLDRRFDDHAKFIEMILDRVLPARSSHG